MASPSHREIERKFLVRHLPPDLANFPRREIEQGYLAAGADGVQVRLRRANGACSLAYKRDAAGGRIEREITLTAEQFAVLWPGTEGQRLSKTRYDVPHENFIVEVDVYRDRHEGLVVAEVEFESEAAAHDFQPPAWLGDDVTGSSRYSNVLLASS